MMYSSLHKRRRSGGVVSLPGPAVAPTAWWQMDSSAPTDITSNPDNLSVLSNIAPSVVSGIRGSCLGINAASAASGSYYARYTMPTGNKLLWSNTQNISINCWVKWSYTSGMLWQIGLGQKVSNGGVAYVITYPSIAITAWGTGHNPAVNYTAANGSKFGTAAINVNPTITPSTWYMYTLVMSYSSPTTTVTGYLNGTSLGSSSFTGTLGNATNPTSMFQITPNDITNLIYYSLIGVWINYALTTTDITKLYNSGAGLQYNGSVFY